MHTLSSRKYALTVRAVLLCVACDIPAARKVCGHAAIVGCSRCLKKFPGRDCSGFVRSDWPKRDITKHREIAKRIRRCNTQTAVDELQKEHGLKYSVLLELEYFNPIRFCIIDPMHNLYLGTAKHILKNIWLDDSSRIITASMFETIQTSVLVPSDIGRVPKKITSSFGTSSFGGFTADQWTTVYSLFALRDLLITISVGKLLYLPVVI